MSRELLHLPSNHWGYLPEQTTGCRGGDTSSHFTHHISHITHGTSHPLGCPLKNWSVGTPYDRAAPLVIVMLRQKIRSTVLRIYPRVVYIYITRAIHRVRCVWRGVMLCVGARNIEVMMGTWECTTEIAPAESVECIYRRMS